MITYEVVFAMTNQVHTEYIKIRIVLGPYIRNDSMIQTMGFL